MTAVGIGIGNGRSGVCLEKRKIKKENKMKKFKKMLVALCLCVCVALSVGLVGCADSKTLAEIDDLKAKIEQKDTTIAEKDAEIDNKNSQIQDLTLTDLEKVGAMAGAFTIAEKTMTGNISSSRSNMLLKDSNGGESNWDVRYKMIGASGSMIGFFMPNLYGGLYDTTKLFGGSLELVQVETDPEYLKIYNANESVKNVTKMVFDYSKTGHSFSLVGDIIVDGALSERDEYKLNVEIENGKVAKYTQEQKLQTLETNGKVTVAYRKLTMNLDYSESGMVYIKAVYTIEAVFYTTDGFDGNIDESAEVSAVVFSGYDTTINKVDMLYGYTVEENPNASQDSEKWDATKALANTKTSKEAALEKANQVKAIKVVDLTNVKVLQTINQ